jgi:CBS domain-containing protein
MKLKNIVIPTGVAHAGMRVREGFEECLRCGVPGIAFVDESGRVAGIFSIRETLRRACIPDIMVNYADLLDNTTDCIDVPEEHMRQVLETPLDGFVKQRYVDITQDTEVSTVVALMEKHSTNYFLVLDDGKYVGVITIWEIARCMLELVND